REATEEINEREPLVVHVPIEPARCVVLAIGVVVAVLRAAEFVAGADHRRALRQDQRREQIPHLAPPQRLYLFVVGGPLRTAVPGTVVGVAVAVLLAVRLVMLVVIGDE